MVVKLLTEHHLEFLSYKKAAQVRLSLLLSKCHIVGNLMHRLTDYTVTDIWTVKLPLSKFVLKPHQIPQAVVCYNCKGIGNQMWRMF